MTDLGADGLYNFLFNFAGTGNEEFAFTIDADPQVTGQVSASERRQKGIITDPIDFKILRNRQVLNSTTGQVEVYDDDDTTIEFTADAWLDEAGTLPYNGTAGVVRRDQFT